MSAEVGPGYYNPMNKATKRGGNILEYNKSVRPRFPRDKRDAQVRYDVFFLIINF